MARNFKNRPAHIRPSVYLIHTRLLAQGLVVGESVPEVIVDSYQHHGDLILLFLRFVLSWNVPSNVSKNHWERETELKGIYDMIDMIFM